MRIRARLGTAGLIGAMGATLAAGALLAPPGVAATPPAPTVTATPAPTVPDSPGTVTGTPVPTVSGSPTTPATSTSCPTYGPPSPGPGGVVASYDFEDGTTRGWSGTGGATVTNTDEVAAGGTRSLRVAGLTTANNVGFSTSTALPYYGWYEVTMKVRVTSPQPSARVILRPANVADSIAGSVEAGTNGWSTVSAYFRPVTLYADWYCNGTMTGAQMPAGGSVRLSLDVVTCGQYIDRPATVFVDDARVAVYGGVAAGTPSVAPTSTVRPPVPAPTSPNCSSTSPPPPATCRVTYTHQSQWAGGYVASVEIRNLTVTAVPNWTLRWTFPDDQTIGTMWGATYIQSGRQVTATAMSWGPLPASGSTTIGFLGTSQGTAGVPTSFALNGTTCAA